MTPLETELKHLLNLMAPPFTEYWKPQCWWKAKYLAQQYPEDYADLPRQLEEAMLAQSSTSGEPATASSETTPPSPSA